MYPRNAFSHFHYVAAELMPQHYRIKMRAMVQHTRDIASADASGADPDLDHAGLYLGRRPIVIANILIAIQHRSLHTGSFFLA